MEGEDNHRPGTGSLVRPARCHRLISRPVVVGAVAARILAGLVLVFGPWTDTASELRGWDVERFVAIARSDAQHWRDVAVEYPPGSVLIFELIDRLNSPGIDSAVGAHRTLVVLALGADLLLAWLLACRARSAGAWYLVLGLPLVPMGLLRLDIVVTLLAGAAALLAVKPEPVTPTPHQSGNGLKVATFVGILAAAGAMVKIWPGLLIGGLWAIGRNRSAALTTLTTAVAGLLWLWRADAGMRPVQQVIDLRGATGWHLESLGGTFTSVADLVGLVDLNAASGVRLELNAFRIGSLIPELVTLSRVAAAIVIVALMVKARRRHRAAAGDSDPLPTLAVAMLGATAVLLVSSPLLSPQFLIWLTPWAALSTIGTPNRWASERWPTPRGLTLAAAVLTGVILAVFQPPNLATPVPAVGLLIRNLLLLALPISCWRSLDRIGHKDAD